jgi:hypothetical protein
MQSKTVILEGTKMERSTMNITSTPKVRQV